MIKLKAQTQATIIQGVFYANSMAQNHILYCHQGVMELQKFNLGYTNIYIVYDGKSGWLTFCACQSPSENCVPVVFLIKGDLITSGVEGET